MTVLVAYATHSGATRTLAETIAETLVGEGVAADVVDIEDAPDPSAYDAVVVGSAVRIESVEKSLERWSAAHADALASRPVAFFSCSGSAADPAKREHQKATDGYLAHAPFEAVAAANFPGWVLMDRIPMHERVMLKSMRTPTGDFRDLDLVASWAREIRPSLAG